MLEFLKFNIGRCFSGDTNVEIIVEDKVLKLKYNKNSHSVSEEQILLPIKDYKKWLEKLESLQINKWRSEYEPDEHMYGGEHWGLDYKVAGKRCRHISGYNAYPDNWIDFLTLMGEICPIYVPMQLDILEFYYQTQKANFPIDELSVQPKYIEQSEKIIINRTNNTFTYIQKSENNYEIKRECNVKKAISELLDDLDYELSKEENASNTKTKESGFELKLHYHNGDEKIIKGEYNRPNLPEKWGYIIFKLEKFLTCYGVLGDVFNSCIYGKGVKAGEIIYCSVNFRDGNKDFYYQTDDDSLCIGEKVIVPWGKENLRREGIIEKIEYFVEENFPFPIEKTKHIVSRA